MRKRSGRPPKYAAVPNETIDDNTRLDFMALGLLTVLIRHMDGWDITLATIGKQYGYGEEAMANAMGLLQVSRYVVKVRSMAASGQWSTEVVVFDTPATDQEVEDLLRQIRVENPHCKAVSVISPTKKALEKAAKRRSALHPIHRLRENPDSVTSWGNDAFPQVGTESGVSRDSAGPGVIKKTVPQKTREDDAPQAARSASGRRRPSTGSSAREADGGEAASGKTKPARLTRQQQAAVNEVFALLPEALRTSIKPGSRGLPQAILEALATGEPWERTPEQLVRCRVMPRWDRHWAGEYYAGQLPASPVGPLREMLKRNPLCNDARCDEHVEVDSGEPCRSCAGKRQNRRGEKAAASAEHGAAGKVDWYPDMPEADTGEPPEWATDAGPGLPGQRDDEPADWNIPAPPMVPVGLGDRPSNEYRRQREAARARKAGAR